MAYLRLSKLDAERMQKNWVYGSGDFAARMGCRLFDSLKHDLIEESRLVLISKPDNEGHVQVDVLTVLLVTFTLQREYRDVYIPPIY